MDYVEYLARKKSVKRGSYVVTPCNGNGVVVPEAVAEREPQTLVPSPIIDYSLAQEEVAKIIQFKTKSIYLAVSHSLTVYNIYRGNLSDYADPELLCQTGLFKRRSAGRRLGML